MTINELREARNKAWQGAKAFVESKRDKDGLLSAEDAAAYADMEKKIKDYSAEIERMEQMSEYRGKYSATATLRKLMKIMSYGMDLIRDGEVLQDSIYALDSSLNELRTFPIDPMVSVYENYRLYPMAVLGKATLMSAVERRESRGAHFRKDFPGEKSEFMKCSVAEFKDEKIRIYFEQESGEKGGAVR